MPSPAWETTAASTEASRIIAVVREAGEPWVDERRTDSRAKKHPATAALKPMKQEAYTEDACPGISRVDGH